MAEIILLPHQIKHYAEIKEMTMKNHTVMNGSDLGTGKTIITLALAKEFGYSIIVICPKLMVEKWKQLAKQYGVNILVVMTYQTLRGTRGKVKHNLLTIRNESYYPSKEYLDCVHKGIFLVYDEVQNLMNETAQNRAAHCLSRTLIKEGETSRIIALSGTPGCKERHCPPLLKAMGFCLSSSYYYYDQVAQCYITEGYGYSEVYNKAKEYNLELAEEIHSSDFVTNKTYNRLLYRYFSECILPAIRSCMPPMQFEAKRDAKLGLYTFPEKDVEKLKRAYNSIYASIDDQGILRANITRPCIEVGLACVNTLVRLTEINIEQGYKVILFVEYRDVRDQLYSRLMRYDPLFLDGEVPYKNREINRQAFQEPNMNHPLFIVNPRSGSSGIDLDDQYGGFPRISYLIPSYHFIDAVQAAGRNYRSTTRSTAKVRIVESDAFNGITRIISTLLQKSTTTKTLSGDNGMVLPSDYPVIKEEDDL